MSLFVVLFEFFVVLSVPLSLSFKTVCCWAKSKNRAAQNTFFLLEYLEIGNSAKLNDLRMCIAHSLSCLLLPFYVEQYNDHKTVYYLSTTIFTGSCCRYLYLSVDVSRSSLFLPLLFFCSSASPATNDKHVRYQKGICHEKQWKLTEKRAHSKKKTIKRNNCFYLFISLEICYVCYNI